MRRARLAAPAWLTSATTGLSLKLGVASALVVSVIIGGGAHFAYRGEQERLLRTMRQAAVIEGRLVLTGLESAMLENNRRLLIDLIAEYGRGAGVERIYLVDGTGRVALTTESSWLGRSIELPANLCPICPVPTDGARTPMTVLNAEDQSVLRSLTLIANEDRCHRCHPAEQTLLGVLGVDFSTMPLHDARAAMIARTLEWGTAMSVLVLLAVGAVVQFGALRPLRSVRDAARSLPVPDSAPAPSARRDEIGELADDIRMVSLTLQRSKEEVDFQRRFLVDFIDRMDDGVAIFDGQLRVVAANKSYIGRISRLEARLDGTGSVDDDGHASLHDEVPVCDATHRAKRSGRVEKALYRWDVGDHEVFYEVFASPMAGNSGTVEHIVEVWRDVTERIQLEANLAHSEQLASLGVLASGFSHEISTPLATIAVSIQGILRRLREVDALGHSGVEDLRARLTTASEEVFRCRDITRSLLDLSRPRRTAAERIDATAVISRMLAVVGPMAEQHDVALSWAGGSALPPLTGHRDQLEQLMLNLYVNAIEAMPEGGTLTVTATQAGQSLEIDVADTGSGIASSDRKKIFEPFFSRKSGGSGLGLYLGRQVAEAHGGKIEVVESTATGTRIRIVLPCADDGICVGASGAGGDLRE